jgi:hypothetical protein
VEDVTANQGFLSVDRLAHLLRAQGAPTSTGPETIEVAAFQEGDTNAVRPFTIQLHSRADQDGKLVWVFEGGAAIALDDSLF